MTFLPHITPIVAPGTPDGSSSPRRALILHGILGRGRNWRSIATRLVGEHPSWEIGLVDLRNHGMSHGAPGPHDLAAAAQDVLRAMDQDSRPVEVVYGHSYGGKVALQVAAAAPAGLREVWVLDSPPGRSDDLPDEQREVEHVIGTLATVPVPATSRDEVTTALSNAGLSRALVGWMGTNLVRAEGGYRWHFDLDAIIEMLHSYRAADLWPVVEVPPAGVSLHLLRAARSDRWTPAMIARLDAAGGHPAVTVHSMDAGHWVHADDPDGLLRLLSTALARGNAPAPDPS